MGMILIIVLSVLFNVSVNASLLSKMKPFLPVLGFYTIMNLPIYGVGLLSAPDVAGGLGSMTDFSIVRNRLPPGMTANEYITCPEGVCPNAQVIKAPEFNVDVKKLEKIVDKIILDSDLRTSFIKEDKATNRREYIQRMRLLNWPDVITVEFFGDSKKSTLAMHSYSIYGGSDLNVNRDRVRGWLAKIDKELNQ